MKVPRKRLRDFVKVDDGRIGIIVANDLCPGVFRGQAVVWFGAMKDANKPLVEMLCVTDKWELVEDEP